MQIKNEYPEVCALCPCPGGDNTGRLLRPLPWTTCTDGKRRSACRCGNLAPLPKRRALAISLAREGFDRKACAALPTSATATAPSAPPERGCCLLGLAPFLLLVLRLSALGRNANLARGICGSSFVGPCLCFSGCFRFPWIAARTRPQCYVLF